MSFFNQQVRTFLLAVVVVVGVVCLLGCGGGEGALVGTWEDVSGGDALDIFKDGTGVIEDVGNFTWKVDGKRFVIMVNEITKVGEYSVKGYVFTWTLTDGTVATFVRKGKMEEYEKKNAGKVDPKVAAMVAPGEVGLMFASFKSAVLGAVAEKGDKFTKKDLGFEPSKDSKYFIYTVSEDGASCTATARIDIGDFKKGSTITIRYDKVKDDFVYSSSQLDVAKKLFPNIFANGNVEGDNSSTSTTPPPAQSVQTSAPIENAKSPTALVPTGYKILEEVKGDLNKDGLEDHVFVIASKQDESRRGIVIAFNKGESYENVLENRDVFSYDVDDVTFDPPAVGVTIKKGILGIETSSMVVRPYRSQRSYKFRFQNSDFELIGYDESDTYGPNTLRAVSINILSNKMQTKENKDEDGNSEEFNEKWNDIVIKEPIKLRNGLAVMKYITVK
jgi:hypothetical protein